MPLTRKQVSLRLQELEERDDVVWSPEEEINSQQSQEESDHAVLSFWFTAEDPANAEARDNQRQNQAQDV